MHVNKIEKGTKIIVAFDSNNELPKINILFSCHYYYLKNIFLYLENK